LQRTIQENNQGKQKMQKSSIIIINHPDTSNIQPSINIIIDNIVDVMAPTQRSNGGSSANDRKRSRTAGSDVGNATDQQSTKELMAASAAARHAKNKKNHSTKNITGTGSSRDSNTQSKDGISDPMMMNINTQSQHLTTYGLVILVVAIAVGMVWNHHEATRTDPTIRAIWSIACTSSSSSSPNKALCGRMVHPTRRTLKATRPIRAGESLVEIPRSLQVWELDALRYPFIQNEGLLEARHDLTKNPLPGGAFLAVYLAMEQKKRYDTTNSFGGDIEVNNDNSTRNNELRKLHSAYLKALPSWEELIDHPLLWQRDELKSLLGVNSWSYAVVLMYREMITSEYKAFSTASGTFASQINKTDYDVARIHVLTRSFNPGPEGCLADEEELSLDERTTLQQKMGLLEEDSTGKVVELFAEGCHAMVPFLDMLNHHPKPNVLYKYDIEKRAFVITAKTNIPVEWELIDSYGKYSDSHLFAKFGFVNGDGSAYTQASIALFHRPLDIQMKNEFSMLPLEVQKQLKGPTSATTKFLIPEFQQDELKRYLQYDDGYHECIQEGLHPKAYALKVLKWKHLAKIANNPNHWIVALHPRSPESVPVQSSDISITTEPPQIDPRKLRMDITHLVETCRLLALTLDDYNGMASEVLQKNLANNSFVVGRGDEALEYRALMFLARLASTALQQYPKNPPQQYEIVAQLNLDAFGSRNWTAAHLRLGEMQVRQKEKKDMYGLYIFHL
jgi:hypothetical protein